MPLVALPLLLISFLLAGCEQSSGSSLRGPQPKVRSPRPFALLSRPGTQPAVELSAQTRTCQRFKGGSTCSGIATAVPPTGPRPGGLSVVRPGERLHLRLPRSARSVFRVIEHLCQPLGRPVALSPPDGSSWKVQLPPGRYVVRVSFTWSGRKGAVDETGIIGLLVSRTAKLGVVPTPPCH